ncbi:wax ester/triacylglycerol synthase domain-containing protein [Rhodococcus sp. NPDC003383]
MGRKSGTELAARDAVYVYGDRANRGDTPSVMTHFYVFDTRQGSTPIATHAEAVDWILERTHRTPALRRRLQRVPWDLGYPYWVEAAVDPDHHIDFRRIGHTTRPHLHRLFASLAEQPLDFGRPLWKLHVLSDVRGVGALPDHATVVVLRVHHSIADGKGAVQIARALFDDPAAEPSRGGTPVPVPGPVAAVRKLPGDYVRYAGAVRRWMRGRRSLRALVASGEIAQPRTPRPRTRFNVVDDSTRLFGRVRFELRDVRALGHATGTTVNDVILAVVSDAVGTYLAERGETPAASLAAHVPISVGARSGLVAENKISDLHVDLHTDRTDPLTRLHLIHESVAREKDRVWRPEWIAVESSLDAVPSLCMRYSLWRAVRKAVVSTCGRAGATNTGLSNVPRGSADALRFGDSPAVGGFSVPCLNRLVGLMHSVVTLGDALDLTFSTKQAVMPDPEAYEHLLEGAFDRLWSAVPATASAL